MRNIRFFGVAKVFSFFGLVFLALSFLSGNSFACYDEPDCVITNGTTDLIAGQHTDVGDLKVSNKLGILYVEYKTDSGWLMSETHLHVATKLSDIPQANGNPIPGQFEYKGEYNPKTDYVKYEIPLSKFGCEKILYIAAHAVVCKDKLGSFPSGSFYVEFYHSIDSIFDVYVNAPTLNGTFPGFCVDIDNGSFVYCFRPF